MASAARLHVQVRSHAVEVLQRTEDEELLYYLLQLVQALRYQAKTHSRLSNFLIARATKNPVMGTLLHWSASLLPCLPVNLAFAWNPQNVPFAVSECNRDVPCI